MELSKVQKVILLYTLYLSPPTRAKEATWESFTGGKSCSETTVFTINGQILADTDELYVFWKELEDFMQDQVDGLK